MTKHILTRESQGRNEMRKITPTCSCGWRGIGYEAHNDWQHTLVVEQERDHIRVNTRKLDPDPDPFNGDDGPDPAQLGE